MQYIRAACSLILLAVLAAGCAAAGAARSPATPTLAVLALSSTPAPSATSSPTATAIPPTPTDTAAAPPVAARPPETATAWIDEAAFRGEGALAFARNGQMSILDGVNRTLRAVGPAPTAGVAARVSSPRWSADGEWLAYLRTTKARPFDWSGDLWIARRDGSAAHPVAGLPGPVTPDGFAWSPMADVLAVGNWIVSPSGTARPIAGTTGPVDSFAWSPDGKTLTYVVTLPSRDPQRRSDALDTVSASGGTPVQQLVDQQAGIVLAGWWPDGKGLLFWRDPGHSASLLADGAPLETLALGTHTPRKLALGGNGSASPLVTLARPAWLAWSPDGRHLALVAGGGRDATTNKTLAVCDFPSWTCRALVQPSGSVSLDPAWSPDGRHLAFVRAAAAVPNRGVAYTAAWDATHTLWVANADGSGARELTGAGTGVEAPRWSRDGSQLLYVREGRLWLIDTAGGLPAWIVDLRAGNQNPAISTDHDWDDWSRAFAWHQ